MVLYRDELLHGPHSIWEIVFCKDIMRYNGQFFRCTQLYILHNEKYVISSSEDQCGCFIQWRTMVLQNWVYKYCMYGVPFHLFPSQNGEAWLKIHAILSAKHFFLKKKTTDNFTQIYKSLRFNNHWSLLNANKHKGKIY